MELLKGLPENGLAKEKSICRMFFTAGGKYYREINDNTQTGGMWRRILLTVVFCETKYKIVIVKIRTGFL